jgi:uncharacterized Zn-binding protein involved in type VI secretion
MGLPAGRLTDQTYGTCYYSSHHDPYSTGGMIITGSPNVFENSLQASSIGDIVLSFCGHVGVIVTGSPTVLVNGKPHAKLSDFHSGTFQGNIITGSGNVMV